MKRNLFLLIFTVLAKISSAQCYAVTQIPYAPDSFNLGTQVLPQGDDQYSNVLHMPFTFCFYGNVYDYCMLGSNGVLTFDTSNVAGYCAWPIGAAIPSPSAQTNAIFLPWADMYMPFDSLPHMYYNVYGTAPNRRFVTSIYQTPMYSCTTLVMTSQVMLYETTNIIEIHIQNKGMCAWNGGYAVDGIQDITGTEAAVVPGRNWPSVWTATNDAWRFTPNCCPTGISSPDANQQFSVYPNPSSGELHFISQNISVKEFYLTVEDVTGREIYADELSANYERSIALDAPKGIYFLQMRGSKGEILGTKKIVVE